MNNLVKNNIKVSVIIPVYNAGPRLHNCIGSLINQSLKEIELIFILDCPTDGSDLIVFEYAKNSSQVKVIINDSNINIGMSRNKGIMASTGEYIAFCDHDDTVAPDMYEKLYNIGMSEKCDVVLGAPEYVYSNVAHNEKFYYPNSDNLQTALFDAMIGRESIADTGWDFYYSHGVIWDKIYKREFLQKNGIRFADNNKITFEDNLFLIECLYKADRVSVYNNIVYYHYIGNSNTAASYEYSSYPLVIGYIRFLGDFLDNNNILNLYLTRFSNSVVMYTMSTIANEINHGRMWSKDLLDMLAMLKRCKYIKLSYRNATIFPKYKGKVKQMLSEAVKLLFKI